MSPLGFQRISSHSIALKLNSYSLVLPSGFIKSLMNHKWHQDYLQSFMPSNFTLTRTDFALNVGHIHFGSVSEFRGHYFVDLEFHNVTMPPCHNSAVSQFRMSTVSLCHSTSPAFCSGLGACRLVYRLGLLDYAHTQSLVVNLLVKNGVYCNYYRQSNRSQTLLNEDYA